MEYVLIDIRVKLQFGLAPLAFTLHFCFLFFFRAFTLSPHYSRMLLFA